MTLDHQLLEKSCLLFDEDGPWAPDTEPGTQSSTEWATRAISDIIRDVLVTLGKMFSCQQMHTQRTLLRIKGTEQQ